MRFVWAPRAAKLEIDVSGDRQRLERDDDGWWRGNVELLKPGDDYRFWVDDRGPFPDPRSQFQPQGVHGASRRVDHAAFAWDDQLWQAKPLSAALIYEMHVGTFTPEGTFDSTIERLDYLIDLGVTHLELMPVAEFLGNYGWGYDGVFPFAPHHAYGGPDGLKRLVNECHRRGLAVLLDVVYNHLGPSGNYAPQFAPYFTDRHTTPWGAGVNFDGPESNEVRRFVIDNALMWLRDYHIDGLRIDAVHAIVDLSALHILEELAAEVNELEAELGRHLVLIAESDLNDPRIVRSWDLGGFGLDAQWSDDVHHAIHAVLTGEQNGYYADFGSLDELATSLMRPYVYAGQQSAYRRRRHGRPPLGLPANRFVVYSQNHDQLGNRAQGERLRHLTNEDRAMIGAALILLGPYVPMLYQGEEWAATAPFQYFVDFQEEPELAKAVAEGRKREFAAFGWSDEEIPDPRDRATFERSRLNWNEMNEPQHRKMCDWYRRLILLRSEIPALTTGRLDLVSVTHSEEQQWLCLVRDTVAILCNFAGETRTVPTPDRVATLLLASKPPETIADKSVDLPPESVAVFGPPRKGSD